MATSTRKDYSDFWAYLFLVYAAALLLYPIVFTREGSFFIKQDNLHQAYPFYNKLAIALHKGYLPVWDANTYGGKNFAGELQTGIFYPVNIVWCLIFGSATGIGTYYLDLLMALHFLICLFGMYSLAKVFKMPPPAAVAAALVFSFSGAVGARAAGQTCIFCGLTLMPWSIYFTVRYWLGNRYKLYLIISGLFAGLEILAGHMQPFFHTILINAIIILFYSYSDSKDLKSFVLPGVTKVCLIVISGFVTALPQLYYASQYLARCYRTVSGGVFISPGEKVPLYIYGHWFIIKPENLFNFFVQGYAQPDDDNTLYMGILPFLLVLSWLLWRKCGIISEHFCNLTKLLSIILLIGFLSALGYLTFFHLILYEVPFVNLVRQLGRYIIMISFSGSLLAGLAITHLKGFSEIFVLNSRTMKIAVLGFIGLNALYLMVFQQKYIPIAVSIPIGLVSLFFLAISEVKKPLYLSIGAVAIIVADLFLNPVSYFSTRTPFYPDHFYARNRIVDTLEATYGKYRVAFQMNNYSLVRRNLGAIYTIQTNWGYGATVNKPYADFTEMDHVRNPEINDLLNVRYVLADAPLDSNFIFKDSLGQIMLYERKTWYPRCYWKRQLGKQGNEIEIENQGFIRELAYSDYYQKFDVRCEIPDTLIFSENDYPGWTCFDNGKNIKTFSPTIKNYTPLFRAIVLNKGEHLIEFRYNKVFSFF